MIKNLFNKPRGTNLYQLMLAMTLGLSACAPVSQTPNTDILVKQAAATIIALTAQADRTPIPNYTIIGRKESTPGKCLLDIQIPTILSKDALTGLAYHILHSDTNKDCASVWIYYFLPNQIVGTDVAWAYTAFTPALDLHINGLTTEAQATYSAITPTGPGVLGKWLDTWGVTRTITFRREGEKYIMTSVYSDGSGETQELTPVYVGSEMRLYGKGADTGVYIVFESDGTLGFYDNQGIIYYAQPQ